jgi:hypothetical protein
MKTGRIITTLVAVMAVGVVLTTQVNAKEFDLQKADVHDRMHYHRAIDAAVWAMPLMNFKFYRDAGHWAQAQQPMCEVSQSATRRLVHWAQKHSA